MEIIEAVLFWCMVVNLGALTFVFGALTAFRPLVLRIHSQLFGVPEDFVAKCAYASLGIYKLLTIFFVVIPWVAIKIATS